MADYVICVDDEQAVLNQLSDQLSRQLGDRYRVECAQSAEEALDLMKELTQAGDSVNMVICDQMMPGMKGDRFLEAVNNGWPDAMKILLTGEAGLDSAIYAINYSGLHRYIEKPWQPEDLLLAVQNLLTQFRLRRDMAHYHARLERKNRQLRSLHEVGIELGATEDPAKILSVTQSAACRILGLDHAATVAIVGRDQAPRWFGLPCDGVDTKLRTELEAIILERRAQSSEPSQTLPPGRFDPPETPFPGRVEPLGHGHKLYGWLLLPGAADRSPETDDVVAVLAGLASSSLRNIELIAARIDTERLSTIGRMLSSIVHDFRNPMTLIKGYGSMLAEPGLLDERRKQYSDLIVQEADRISAMIEELLDYTRGRRTALRPARITVPALVEQFRTWINDDLTQRGIGLSLRLDYDGPLVVDIDRIKRALLNVATNAMDAMDSGGTLTVESRTHDGAVELSLCDTGRGIPAELQSRVFEPFFTHGKRHGLGLGMTITRKIVEEHGGEVLLSSTAGLGTRLTFRFPENEIARA
jgi:two-component system chemotaxis response regulator CheY